MGENDAKGKTQRPTMRLVFCGFSLQAKTETKTEKTNDEIGLLWFFFARRNPRKNQEKNEKD